MRFHWWEEDDENDVVVVDAPMPLLVLAFVLGLSVTPD